MAGDTNEAKVYNYLAAKNVLSPVQIAGLMGNWSVESGFDPTSYFPSSHTDNPDPSTAFGLVEWLGGRQTNLRALSVSEGKPITDLGVQLDYAWSELTGPSYKDTVLTPLEAATDLATAVHIVNLNYEGSGVGDQPRLDAATRILATDGSGTVSQTSGATVSDASCSGGADPSNGVIEQGTSAQLAQKLLADQAGGTYHCDNAGDCADLNKVAAGTSIAGPGGCLATTLDPRVLQILLYAIEVGNFKVGTFAMCGDHGYDNPSGHSGGFAVDISSINGVAVNQDTAAAKTQTLALDNFLNGVPAAINIDQHISYGYGEHYDADLAATQKAQGVLCNDTCVSFYTQAIEAEHENHIHVGFKPPSS